MKFSISTAVIATMMMANESMAQNTMVKMCLHYDNESGHARSDPIINQQCSSGHVHTFYGPQNFHPNTSYEDIRDTNPRYSSSPVEENQSLYWHPAIYEVVENNDGSNTYTRVSNLDSSTYYRWHNNEETQAFPPGFRMIADANDLPASVHGQTRDNMPIRTECCNFDGDDQLNAEETCEFFDTVVLPDNRRCDDLGIAFAFPTCWDGVSLGDDNDHRSHMAYTTNGMVDGPCPSGFPVRLPEAQIFVRINGYDSTNKRYQLSDASNEFHADFFNGWREGTLQNIIDNCETDTSDDFGYNPPCACTPDGEFNPTNQFLTTNNRVASRVCDIDVRELIIDEATDVTNTLPMGSCEGPALKPKSWTQITSDLFDCAVTPVSSPTVAPVATPTDPSQCQDEASFVANNGRTRDCNWVANRMGRRCPKYDTYCPVTCDTCATNPTQAPVPDPTQAPVPDPTQAPIPDPTQAPVPDPTQAPVTTGAVCYDRTLAFRNDPSKNCAWVGAKANRRCNKEWQEKQLWEWCPEACSMDCNTCCNINVWECEDANPNDASCMTAFDACTQTC